MINKKIYRYTNVKYILFLFGFIFIFSGCRTTRNDTGSSAAIMKTEEEFFHALSDQALGFQTLSARLQLEMRLASGKQFSTRGQMKIDKDNCIQISIQPVFGIEMFRIELTPDSIKLMDRMNKRFLAEDYRNFINESKISFNFYNLQALFTNRIFLPGEPRIANDAYKRYRWEQTTDGYLLRTKDKAGMQYLFTAGNDEKLRTATITDAAQYTFNWDYSDFRTVENKPFPMKMNGFLKSDNNKRNSITMNYSRIDINTPLNMKTTVPRGYERVTFSQIMKSFEAL